MASSPDDGAIASDLTNFCYSLMVAIMKSGINRSLDGTRAIPIVIAFRLLADSQHRARIDTSEYFIIPRVYVRILNSDRSAADAIDAVNVSGDPALRRFNNSLNSLP